MKVDFNFLVFASNIHTSFSLVSYTLVYHTATAEILLSALHTAVLRLWAMSCHSVCMVGMALLQKFCHVNVAAVPGSAT